MQFTTSIYKMQGMLKLEAFHKHTLYCTELHNQNYLKINIIYVCSLA